MAQKLLPKPQAAWAKILPTGLFTWLIQLHNRVNENIQILWPQVDTTDADIADFGNKSHQSLDNILPAVDTSTDATQNRHISDSQAKGWTDHVSATSAHGATGAVIGVGDTATTTTPGVVSQTAAVVDLNQTISNPPTTSEVQAISDKIDELLGKMRSSGQLDT